MMILKDICDFTKEELEKFPPLPEYMRKRLEPDGDPQKHIEAIKYADLCWDGKEDGSEGEWRICPEMC